MPRVGTCKDCGARFKIPDGVMAASAKCTRCGGVVAIPPADSAPPVASGPVAPAPRAAAPSGAPAAPVRSAALPTRDRKLRGVVRASRRVGKDAAPAAAGTHATAGVGLHSRGVRTRVRGAKKKASPGLLLFAAVLVIGCGVGAWFAMSAGAEPATELPPANPDAPAADQPSLGSQPVEETFAPATVAAAEAAPAVHVVALAEADTPASAEPPAAPPPTAPTIEDPAPRDPTVAIEALGPLPGTTAGQLVKWTALVKSVYHDDPPPRTRRRLIGQLEEIDIVNCTPAYINAVNGLDMSNPIDIRNAASLIGDWSKRQGYQLHFAFNQEASKVGTNDINNRVIAIEGWRTAFAARMVDEAALARYRANVAAALLDQDDGR